MDISESWKRRPLAVAPGFVGVAILAAGVGCERRAEAVTIDEAASPAAVRNGPRKGNVYVLAPPPVHIGYHKTSTTWLQLEFFEGDAASHVLATHEGIDRAIVRPHSLDFDVETARAMLTTGMAGRGLQQHQHDERMYAIQNGRALPG